MLFKQNVIRKVTHCLLILLLSFISIPVIAGEDPLDTITPINGKIEYNKVYAENLNELTLTLGDNDKHKLREKAPGAELDGTIKLTPQETELKDALEFQKGKDIEDIKMLWESTVERNAIIRFALEKIASPPQQRAVKSSLMARSISTMLQGAAIVPSLFGMGAATEYGGAFGGQLLSNAFNRKFLPTPGAPAITEPELIQLTGLIEDLQETIINNYYNYKSSLESLLMEKQNTVLQEKNYKQALASNDPTAIIISSALFDKSKQSETRLKQQAKLYRVQLERLAGIEAVANLNLSLSEKVIQAKFNYEKYKQSTTSDNTASENILEKPKSSLKLKETTTPTADIQTTPLNSDLNNTLKPKKDKQNLNELQEKPVDVIE
ncbi:MAG: hypothetical protein AB1782_16205 [Cyanobacteriota bacterium]